MPPKVGQERGVEREGRRNSSRSWSYRGASSVGEIRKQARRNPTELSPDHPNVKGLETIRRGGAGAPPPPSVRNPVQPDQAKLDHAIDQILHHGKTTKPKKSARPVEPEREKGKSPTSPIAPNGHGGLLGKVDALLKGWANLLGKIGIGGGPFLLMALPPKTGRQVPTVITPPKASTEFVVGRAPEGVSPQNRIVLTKDNVALDLSDRVSRVHISFQYREGKGWFIYDGARDLSERSKHGVWVNGERMNEKYQEIRPGSRIDIPGISFIFEPIPVREAEAKGKSKIPPTPSRSQRRELNGILDQITSPKTSDIQKKESFRKLLELVQEAPWCFEPKVVEKVKEGWLAGEAWARPVLGELVERGNPHAVSQLREWVHSPNLKTQTQAYYFLLGLKGENAQRLLLDGFDAALKYEKSLPHESSMRTPLISKMRHDFNLWSLKTRGFMSGYVGGVILNNFTGVGVWVNQETGLIEKFSKSAPPPWLYDHFFIEMQIHDHKEVIHWVEQAAGQKNQSLHLNSLQSLTGINLDSYSPVPPPMNPIEQAPYR